MQHDSIPFAPRVILRQQACPATAMTQASRSFPPHPRAAFACAPSALPSHRKKGGRLIRGSR